MRLRFTLCACSVLFESATATFNAYATSHPEVTAKALDISSGCLSALNQTVHCDDESLTLASEGGLNNNWTLENVTALCTDECTNSLSSWVSAVESQCAGEQVSTGKFGVDLKSFTVKFIVGYDSVCIQDRFENYCLLESQKPPDESPCPPSASQRSEICHSGDTNEGFSSPELVREGTSQEQTPITDANDPDVDCNYCLARLLQVGILQELMFPLARLVPSENYYNNLKESCTTRNPSEAVVDPSNPAGYATEKQLPKRAVSAPKPGPFYTIGTPAMPTQPGALESCGYYYNVMPGDTCVKVAERAGISYQDLLNYNTGLEQSCRNLWSNYAVCVAPVTKSAVSTDGQCGEDVTCVGSPFGSCCNEDEQCQQCPLEEPTPPDSPKDDDSPLEEDDDDDSSSEDDELFGDNAPRRGGSKDELPDKKPVQGEPQAPGNSTLISKDGKCSKKISCVGSGFGNCCSTSLYCGSGPKYCGFGNCISGKCDTGMGGESTDGTCGPLFPGNKTCVGTSFGECCSINGYCGSTKDYCNPENCYSGKCFKGKRPKRDP